MTLPVKNAKDIELPWVHFFFYGPTGSGKTVASSTFPDCYFIVPKNEQSIVTLMGQDIDYVEVIGKSGTPSTHGGWGLENVISELEALYKSDPSKFPYQTIVIESLSHYMDLVIEELTRGNKLDMDWSKWGELSSHLRNVQQRLRNLEVHAVFTSLSKTEVAEGGNRVVGGPLMQGQTAVKLPSACDVIAFCECVPGKPTRYITHFKPYKGFDARSRFRAMPDKVENFDFAQIEQFLTGGNINQSNEVTKQNGKKETQKNDRV